MGAKDPRVDAYIERSADFAQPILGHIRGIVHASCPEAGETLKCVKKAKALNEAGTPGPISRRARSKGEPDVPEDLMAALKKNKKARATFEGLPPGHRREYADWINEAKRPETRAKRIATTLEWLAEGKRRNWKYEKC